jgi:integrase
VPPQRKTSYEVRLWSVRKVTSRTGVTSRSGTAKGRPTARYEIRWVVEKKTRSKTFTTRALAESHRSDLMSALNRGEPFDIETGLPVSMLPDERDTTWWEWAIEYTDLKWPTLAPTSRRSIAEALTTATMALLDTEKNRPPAKKLRSAMKRWAFVTPRRKAGPPPTDIADAVTWLSRHTVKLARLEDTRLARRVLDALALSLDGSQAAATTIARKRAVIYNAFELAAERELLAVNPLSKVRWRAPKVNDVVDPAAVINPRQAEELLAAVAQVGAGNASLPSTGRRKVPKKEARTPPGAPLVAFFGCLYYAAMRPSEALALRDTDLQLPDTDQAWGRIRIARGNPNVAGLWSDSGRREPRQLKHRAAGAVRVMGAPPQLVVLLRAHLQIYGAAQDGRLFRGPQGGSIRDEDYQEVWQAARRLALPDADASPLARRPYDLRHACVSTWLAAGVDSAQVAAWAGHSIAVLHRVYAHVVHGREDVARQRVGDILRRDCELANGLQ